MSTLVRLVPTIVENHHRNALKLIFTSNAKYSSNNNNKKLIDNANNVRPMVMEQDINADTENPSDDSLEEPTTCCMSGCANCVWIQYAEKLSEKLQNSNDDVQKIIMDKVSDPNMRAFLSMELRCRNLIK